MIGNAPRCQGFTLLEVVVAVACAALLLAGAYASLGGTLRNADKASSVMNAALTAASISDALTAGTIPATQSSTSDSRALQHWTVAPKALAADNESLLQHVDIRVTSTARGDQPLVAASLLLRGAPAP
jgi:prepilin-type N-terminal cleavage/methylation domain-containing protein